MPICGLCASRGVARTLSHRPPKRTNRPSYTPLATAAIPTPDEAERRLPRVAEGRSPYSRVRVHVIRAQLDCIIALALQMGLRRGEIFGLSIDDIWDGNAGVVVRDRNGLLDDAREVPWTSDAHRATAEWRKCRSYLAPQHDRPWLNLHSAATGREPMTIHTFNRLLVTYIGPAWSFQRLRATSAVHGRVVAFRWSVCGSYWESGELRTCCPTRR